MTLGRSLGFFVAMTVLSACDKSAGSSMMSKLQLSHVERKQPAPAATGETPGMLYWMLDRGDVRKLRLADDKSFGRRSYGIVGGTDLALDRHQHLHELFADGSGSGGVVELSSNLKTVRTLDIANAFPSAMAIDEKGFQSVGCFDFGPHAYDIKVYPADAEGTASPVRTIVGHRTGLTAISAMTADSAGNLYVANSLTVQPDVANNLEVFAPRANGNRTPVRTIGGDQTGLTGPVNITLGADGNIYVANQISGGGNPVYDILVFPSDANGDVPPTRTLMSGSYGGTIALGTNGEMYVGYGPSATDAEKLRSNGSYMGGFAVYAPGASGNDQPIGYVGHAVADAYRAVLQYPWYQL